MKPEKSYMETHYNTGVDKSRYARLYTRYIHKKYFKKSGKILDMGCNNGIYLDGFKQLGYDCYGTDVGKDQIQKCFAKGHKIKFFDAEKDDLPFPDETFDFIFCKSMIEHISLNRIFYLLKEFKRVLKKNGKLFILTDEWKRCYKTFYDDATHITPITIKRLTHLLEMTGLKEEGSRHHHNIQFFWKFFPIAFNISRPFPDQIESVSLKVV
ncbi:MAG: class I SAM-dependent methyltransferase [archaeon]